MSLWAFAFSLSSSSPPTRQANRRQVWPQGGAILRARRTRIPDFDRLVVRSRHNLGPVRGKRHRPDVVAVGIRLLAEHLQFDCQTSQHASVLAKEGRFWARGTPESQTLIVLSMMPQLTIFDPSGENWTQEMEPKKPVACAFVFSLSSSNLPAKQASRRQFWPRRGDFELAVHHNPRL